MCVFFFFFFFFFWTPLLPGHIACVRQNMITLQVALPVPGLGQPSAWTSSLGAPQGGEDVRREATVMKHPELSLPTPRVLWLIAQGFSAHTSGFSLPAAQVFLPDASSPQSDAWLATL